MPTFFFKSTLRSLLRNRVHALINLLGLAIGIAVSLVAFLIVTYHLSFDRFHSQVEQICRANTIVNFGSDDYYFQGVPYPLVTVLKEQFPELEEISRIIQTNGTVRLDNQNEGVKIDRIAAVDSSYFNIMEVGWQLGSPQKAFDDPNSIVLSASLGKALFGNENPIGQMVIFNDSINLIVTGLVTSPKPNTNYGFEAFLPSTYFEDRYPNQDQWASINTNHQVIFKVNQHAANPAGKQALEEKLNALYSEHFPNKEVSSTWTLTLQALENIHFDRVYGQPTGTGGNRKMIHAMLAIGFFMVLTACINYVNLTTALNTRRSKEVGIRKILGSRRSFLIRQFLAETAFLVFVATLTGLGLAELFLMQIDQFIPLGISESLLYWGATNTIWLYAFLLGILVSVTIAAGIYPAILLASRSPIGVLKKQLSTRASKASLFLRRSLVVFQFTLTQVLIIGSIVVANQLNYFMDKDLGFDYQAVVYLEMPKTASTERMRFFKNEVQKVRGIENASISDFAPMFAGWQATQILMEIDGEKKEISSHSRIADTDYFEVYKIPFLAGQPFEEKEQPDQIVVNQRFLKEVGIDSFDEALHMEASYGDGKMLQVVGVIPDFHLQSLHEEIKPVFIKYQPEQTRQLNLRINPTMWKDSKASLATIWHEAFSDAPFDPIFLDDTLQSFYQNEQRTLRLFNLFALIAVFIGCLGLYGMVSFMAVQKTKEVGIRKALGASVASIIALFSSEFVRLLLFALLISSPIAYWVMNQWLADYAYRIDFGWEIFALAGFIALGIALFTISFQSVKAALANPTESLRNE